MKVQQRDVLFSFICEILHARSSCQPDDSGKRNDLSNKSSLKFSSLFGVFYYFLHNWLQLSCRGKELSLPFDLILFIQ